MTHSRATVLRQFLIASRTFFLSFLIGGFVVGFFDMGSGATKEKYPRLQLIFQDDWSLNFHKLI